MSGSKAKKILILYSELAGYTVACINAFIKRNPQTDITVISWPVNAEAPFRFQIDRRIKHLSRNECNDERLVELAKTINPGLILCSGWRDKGYVKVARLFSDRTVLLMDNQWKGTLRQRVGVIAFPVLLKKCFNYVWVPGERQAAYAEKLGFDRSHIRTGFYSGDVSLFSNARDHQSQVTNSFPHRFIFAGRYYDFKGVSELWAEFIRFKNEMKSDWQLWCFGIGDVTPVEHTDIRHFGFMQPEEMAKLIKDGGVFVLPSKFEPWGVVVHEFANAGFPLILSNEVGAGDAFLKAGKNGFTFDHRKEGALCEIFKEIVSRSDDQLWEMGKFSTVLASKISTDTWCDTLAELSTLMDQR